MIVTKTKIMTRLAQGRLLEGWIDRVDLSNRRLHVRTGSRDSIGVTVDIPDECEIHHENSSCSCSRSCPVMPSTFATRLTNWESASPRMLN